MADEITISVNISVVKGKLSETIQKNGVKVDMVAGLPKKVSNVQTIGFAAHEALIMGDVASAGYAYFRNTDEVNFVEIGTDVAAVFKPFVKLLPGAVCIVPLGTNAPYALADTAAVELEYTIFAQ